MFWDAFVWSLGVSCGGGIGLIGFMLTWWALQRVTGRAEAMAKRIGVYDQSLDALRERNELTLQTIDALRGIGTAIDEYGLSAGKRG